MRVLAERLHGRHVGLAEHRRVRRHRLAEHVRGVEALVGVVGGGRLQARKDAVIVAKTIDDVREVGDVAAQAQRLLHVVVAARYGDLGLVAARHLLYLSLDKVREKLMKIQKCIGKNLIIAGFLLKYLQMDEFAVLMKNVFIGQKRKKVLNAI